MAFPGTPNAISDILATTIENRSKTIADNVTLNNALLTYLEKRGNQKTVSGGSVIFQELSFAQNGNAGWYSGYDLLPVAAQDVISAASFPIKQAACPVVISGLEMLQNAGKEQMIDLMDARLGVAVPVTPTTGTYGGIDRNTWTFWQSKSTTAGAALTPTTVQAAMNTMWASLVRGMDRPDLIVMDSVFWGIYIASLQANQRFTDPNKAKLGFPTIQYMDADVVLDGGIGGFATTKTAYFLNTRYLFFRPHAQRNMVPLAPNKRYAINQDAECQIIGWAGNLTSSGSQFQGRLITP